MNNLLTEEEKKEFKRWLKPEGISYFRHLLGLKGTVIPVLKLNKDNKCIPLHPVHLREGMQIRNWLRANASFAKNIDSEQLDECYVSILEDAIKE